MATNVATKELLQNVILAAVAAGVAAVEVQFEVIPLPVNGKALEAAVVAVGYAFIRGVVGYFATKANRPLTVDR